MRDNFWKWLKRFFVVLPLIAMFLQFVFYLGSFWRDNATMNFDLGVNDFIESFILTGVSNDVYNPLLYNINTPLLPAGVIGNIYESFYSLFEYFIGDGFSSNYPYFFITFNFLVWWVFVELIFLFFRFVTFLISWVNSLFDNTFKKIKK